MPSAAMAMRTGSVKKCGSAPACSCVVVIVVGVVFVGSRRSCHVRSRRTRWSRRGRSPRTWGSRRRRRLDHVEQALFESSAVHDQRVGTHQRVDLLGRGLEAVGIRSDGHDGHDVRRIADQFADDVTENVGGHDDRRCLGRSIIDIGRGRGLSRVSVFGSVRATAVGILDGPFAVAGAARCEYDTNCATAAAPDRITDLCTSTSLAVAPLMRTTPTLGRVPGSRTAPTTWSPFSAHASDRGARRGHGAGCHDMRNNAAERRALDSRESGSGDESLIWLRPTTPERIELLEEPVSEPRHDLGRSGRGPGE